MIFNRLFTIALVAVLLGGAAGSLALDWSSAPAQTVTLFYPGAASWEAVLIGETHGGADAVRQRRSCSACHQGQEEAMGRTLAIDSGSPMFAPHQGMTAWQTTVQIARDEERLYFRIGTGGVEEGTIAILVDDGAFESSALSGCWATCHQDSRGMPAAGDMDLTKYLPRSRSKNTRTGGGRSFRPRGELDQLIAEGQFVELLGASFSSQVASPIHGYVLESRRMGVEGKLEAEWSDDHLILSRPLAAAGKHQKDFTPGKSYSVGLALLPGNAQGADHLVGFPLRFRLGEDGGVSFIGTK